MKSRLLSAVCACAISLSLATTANAAFVVPTDLNPGDTYQIVFATSTTRDATSFDPADYDAIPQGAEVVIRELRSSLAAGAETITVEVGGRPLRARLEVSARHREILLAGSLLNWAAATG